MRNIAITIFVFIALITASCEGFNSFFMGDGSQEESLVIGKDEDLADDADFAVIPDTELPEEISGPLRDILQADSDDVLVLAEAGDFREGALYVAQSFGDTAPGGVDWLNVALGVGSVFFPGLAAWESLLTFGSRRKKRHYGNALKKLTKPTPTNLGGAVKDIVKAIGASHTSQDTEDLADGKIVVDPDDRILG